MAERDQLAGPLAAHHAGQLGDAEDVALRPAAVDDEAHRLGRDRDRRLGDGPARGDGLARDVDHPRPAGPVHVGEPAPLGARLRSRVHRFLRVGGRVERRVGRRIMPRSSHHSVDLGAGRQAVVGLGDDRQRVGRGEGREDVAPLPARRESDADAAAVVADRRAVRVALGHDAQERAPAVALGDRLAEDGAIDRPEEVAAAGEAPDRRRTNSSNVTKRRDRVAGQAEQQHRRAAARPIGGAERERLAGLDRDPPQVDPADRLERRA